MVDRLTGPPRAQESEDLLEHRAASGAGRHQRVSLGRLLDPGHKAEQQPTIRDLVKLRQLLGKHERETTEGHHIRTEPHPIGHTREQRDAKQRIQNRRDWQSDSQIPSKPLASIARPNATISLRDTQLGCGAIARRTFTPWISQTFTP